MIWVPFYLLLILCMCVCACVRAYMQPQCDCKAIDNVIMITILSFPTHSHTHTHTHTHTQITHITYLIRLCTIKDAAHDSFVPQYAHQQGSVCTPWSFSSWFRCISTSSTQCGRFAPRSKILRPATATGLARDFCQAHGH